MITLCMDTSHRFLTLALIKDDYVLAKFQKECFKKQSETILEELDKLIKDSNLSVNDIDQICITKGPGSYTGVRIAMTIAKVFCAQRKIPLYTLSTLRLFSCGKENCAVYLDARGKRAYFAEYKDGYLVEKEHIVELDKIEHDKNVEIMGDRFLFNLDDCEEDYCESFNINRKYWEKVENIHTCVPEYLKDNNEYLVKS